MASCPNCNSANYRIQEPGALTNAYYCLDCKKSFDRLSPNAKWGIAGTVLTVAAALLGVNLSS
jgi:transposase-like protein